MTRLQILIIITGLIFLIFAVDLYQRKKFNLLHFLVFGGGTGLVMYFILVPGALDTFGATFGLARGADLIVYIAIIVLAYLYIELLNKHGKSDIFTTDLARAVAISQSQGKLNNGSIMFVVPCYGEDETVLATVTDVLNAGYPLVLVDDGNNTVDLKSALDVHIQEGRVVLLTHPVNLGQGAALQTGAEYILKHCQRAEFVVHFDADGQHRVEDLQQYIDAFKNDPSLDIVLGSRFLGEAMNLTGFRKIHKKMQVLFMRVFIGLKLTDTNNGYRMIRTSSLPKLRITLNRMAHASEIETIIRDQKLNYTEVPVTIIYTDYSMTKGQKLSNMRDILGNLFWKWWLFK